jgi:DNA repair exonuclease SbcCD ATPase subunit
MITIQQMRERSGHIRQAFIASRREVEDNQALLAQHHEIRKTAEAVSEIVSKAAQAAQMRFASIVAGVVTESLNSVYPDNPYEFKLEFRECAGKTVVDTLLYRDGEPLDPMSSTGGGVWDVLAFALRVALFVLTAGDNTRKLLVLDEPAKFLHGPEKIRRFYETMESVGKQFNLTILCARQH